MGDCLGLQPDSFSSEVIGRINSFSPYAGQVAKKHIIWKSFVSAAGPAKIWSHRTTILHLQFPIGEVAHDSRQ